MKKITFEELENRMCEYNAKHPDREESPDVYAVIVYSQKNWEKKYTVKQRSYKVANCCRAWQPGKIANSIWGDCLDGSDDGVRLDWYRWDVDYCYML